MLNAQQLTRGMSIIIVEQALAKEAVEQQLIEVSQALARVTGERDALQAQITAMIQDQEGAAGDSEGA